MIRIWRHLPLIAIASACMLLIAGLLAGIYAERLYREQKVNEATAQAQILASSVLAALMFNDDATVQEYVNAQKANPEVLAAAVYDSKGNVVGRYVRAGDRSVPPAPQPQPPRFYDGRLSTVLSVMQGRTALGIVYLEILTETTALRIARYGAVGLLIVMASLVLGVLGAAQAALTRANRELESRASDLAQANMLLRLQIQQREKAEEALRQSQKMEAIGQLSGGIAHDFNNLLTVIQGNLQLMERRLARGDTDVKRFVDFAMDGVARATTVTQRILAFSRRQPLSPKSVDLNHLLRDMEPLLQHSVGALVTLDMRCAASWWTQCDPNQMENAILNLVINARDAMPEGGRLIIETENVSLEDSTADYDDLLPGHYVRVSVIDSGVGMSDEVRSKAIDPFFTTKPVGQGTGLGLSMIFGYVKQSKGALKIDSILGGGTTVTLLMPRYGTAVIADGAASLSSPAAASEHSPTLEEDTPCVFIVEDEALVRELAVETIRSEGFNVVEEADGTAAMDLLKSALHIDMLITDVKLPGVNGFQLAEYVHVSRPGIPILVVTGFTSDPVPAWVASAGIKVLYKPYDLDTLAREARRLLRDTAA